MPIFIFEILIIGLCGKRCGQAAEREVRNSIGPAPKITSQKCRVSRSATGPDHEMAFDMCEIKTNGKLSPSTQLFCFWTLNSRRYKKSIRYRISRYWNVCFQDVRHKLGIRIREWPHGPVPRSASVRSGCCCFAPGISRGSKGRCIEATSSSRSWRDPWDKSGSSCRRESLETQLEWNCGRPLGQGSRVGSSCGSIQSKVKCGPVIEQRLGWARLCWPLIMKWKGFSILRAVVCGSHNGHNGDELWMDGASKWPHKADRLSATEDNTRWLPSVVGNG
jgi:hypothetical protein